MRKTLARLNRDFGGELAVFGNILALAAMTGAVIFGYALNQAGLGLSLSLTAASLAMLLFATGRLLTSLAAEARGATATADENVIEASAYYVAALLPGLGALLA